MRTPILTALITATIASSAGCTHFQEQKKTDEIPKTLKVIDDLTASIKGELQKEKNSTYLKYEVVAESSDFNAQFFKLSPVTNLFLEGSSSIALDFIAKKYGFNIVYDIADEASVEKEIKISTSSMRPYDLIRHIEKTANLDIYLDGTTLIVSDSMTLNGVFSKLEGDKNGDSYKSLKNHLMTILDKSAPAGTASKKIQPEATSEQEVVDEAPVESVTSISSEIVIDENTGAFYLRSKPNSIRQSKEMIESIINSAVSHATVELSIYRINNSRAKEVGISVTKVIDNLYSLSAGSATSKSMFNYLRDEKQANGNALQAGLSLYEKSGIINSASKTTLTVFNATQTMMSDLQAVGNWEPGKLKQDTQIINGASITTYSEEKPEFVEQKVGQSLSLTPRIDINNQVINMAVSYTNSSVYQTESFTWQRVTGIGEPVVITKPLRTENRIEATVVLNQNNHTILAGMRSKDAKINREHIPGMGGMPVLQDIGANASSSNYTDSIIVVRANFPTNPVKQFIEKSKFKKEQ